MGGMQAVTAAFDAATGTQLWAAAYHGPCVGNGRPAAIAVSRGRVFVTGQSSNTATIDVTPCSARASLRGAND